MRELAFGDQEGVFKPGDNKENYAVKRMPEIEQWATDIYNFLTSAVLTFRQTPISNLHYS